MLKKISAVFVVAVALAVAACGDGDARLTTTGPAALTMDDNPFGRAPFVGVSPNTLTPELINNSVACPAVQPFLVRANLQIRVDGDTAVSVDSIRMQFVDVTGIAAPPVTLAAPALTRQFGTALVEARSSRTFGLDFLFGCGVDRRGTIVFVTDTRDRNGRQFTTETRASVR
jgi:hypothetical protein